MFYIKKMINHQRSGTKNEFGETYCVLNLNEQHPPGVSKRSHHFDVIIEVKCFFHGQMAVQHVCRLDLFTSESEFKGELSLILFATTKLS